MGIQNSENGPVQSVFLFFIFFLSILSLFLSLHKKYIIKRYNNSLLSFLFSFGVIFSLFSFFNPCFSIEEKAGDSIQSFTILPIQRVPRYVLLLKEVSFLSFPTFLFLFSLYFILVFLFLFSFPFLIHRE